MKFQVNDPAKPGCWVDQESKPLPPDPDMETLERGIYDTGQKERRTLYEPMSDQWVTGEHTLFIYIRGTGKLPLGVEAYVRKNLDRVIRRWVLTDENPTYGCCQTHA